MAPFAAELESLLSRDEVSGHDFVLGELLGSVARLRLWTADPRLAALASELGVAHD